MGLNRFNVVVMCTVKKKKTNKQTNIQTNKLQIYDKFINGLDRLYEGL